jgi:lysyl-tRNA synthetase class 2
VGKVFRNEGLSHSHNPEFTSLEFYMAYADIEDLIQITQDLLKQMAIDLCGSEKVLISYKDFNKKQEVSSLEIDFGKSFA